MPTKTIKGLKYNARSPGSITNVQHHDSTGSEKDASGSPLAISEIITNSSTATPIGNFAVLRVFNAAGGPAFMWVGKESDEPGTVDATTGVALTQDFHEVFHCEFSDDPKESIMVKTSSDSVQVVLMKC